MPGRELVSMRGLAEFKARLARVHAGSTPAIRRVADDAAQLVVNRTRPRIPIGPAAGGHVRSTLKVASSARSVRVAYGSSRFPYAGWLDFGGRVGRHRSVYRPWIHEGRYVWRSYAELQSRVQGLLREGLEDLARDSGLDVNMGSGR